MLTGKYCRNNEISPYYDDDLITGTDYIDCWVYIRGNETEEEHWDRLKKERGWDKTDNQSLIATFLIINNQAKLIFIQQKDFIPIKFCMMILISS